MFEEAAAYPDGRGLTRWAWIEIDTEALRHNVRQIRKLVGPKVELMAVVKADAYGHGAEQVAKIAIEEGADRLAIATVDEGVKLREQGITVPILLLCEPPITSAPTLVEHDITPTIDTAAFAIAYGDAADARGKVGPFHLGINTGMNRIGLLPEDAIDFLRSIDFHRGIKLSGVFTHFATADEADDWDFRRQLHRFNECIDAMRAAGIDPGTVHAANSAAIIRYPEARFDMVRLGICLYGMHPSPVTHGLVDLKPAMSVKARVVFEKTPRVGEGVSYGLHYRTPGDKQIVTLPLGYADGMRRELSGRCQVIINGRRWDQVGAICMDQMMVEVSPSISPVRPVAPVEVGDECVIIGRQGAEEITLDEQAELLGTINYELAVGFGLRLRRFYV